MAQGRFVATIRGIPEMPNIRAINIRSGPGLNHDPVRRAPVGQTGLDVLDVQPDADGRSFQGKVYQWFQLSFPDGGSGWARDDLIDIEGDGTRFGFGVVVRRVIAFSIQRDLNAIANVAARATSEVMSAIVNAVEESIAEPQRDTPATDAATPEPAPAPTREPIPAPTPPPTASTSTPTAPATSTPGGIIVMGLTGLNMRSGPGTQHTTLARIPYQTELEITDVQPGDQSGDPFMWIQINYNGRDGWVREDFTRLTGNFETFGLGFLDQYPSPVRDTHWGRDFNTDPTKTQFTSFHKGWDHVGDIGEPLLAGPQGGVVTQVAMCSACGAAGISSVDSGFPLNDQRVLNGTEWNFGFGHFVVVRYNHDILPESTQRRLSQRNFAGAHLFVIYAHMQEVSVSQGQQVTAQQRLGTLGNSGNSTGPHLHLEMRAGTNPNATFNSLQAGLMSPGVLFLR